MKSKLEKILKRYDFSLDKKFIAAKPASPRDSAKLLVCGKKSGKVSFDRFFNLPKLLPKDAVLVFNKTKVIPARLILKKQTGGRTAILIVDFNSSPIKVLADRRLKKGESLFSNKKRLFSVFGTHENLFLLKPLFPKKELESILQKHGKTPIPPYIKNSPLSESELRREYQSVFAKVQGSVAAPTASLHFTKRLLRNLEKSGVAIKFITLHVNLGTFAPLVLKNLQTNSLHSEQYKIDSKTARDLNEAKSKSRPIIAVGTTVARALESATVGKKIKKFSGDTKLFIREGYRFQFIDGMITNFHVPKSSLIMLVAAMIGRDNLFKIYELAKAKNCRFFSFGDGMVIL